MPRPRKDTKIKAPVEIPAPENPAKTWLKSYEYEGLIYGAKTLLIRRDKKDTDQMAFKVGSIFAYPGKDNYEELFDMALEFIDERFYRQFENGSPRPAYAMAQNFRALAIELPREVELFGYLPKKDPPPSYYGDEAEYAHLWRLRDRAMEEE